MELLAQLNGTPFVLPDLQLNGETWGDDVTTTVICCSADDVIVQESGLS